MKEIKHAVKHVNKYAKFILKGTPALDPDSQAINVSNNDDDCAVKSNHSKP